MFFPPKVNMNAKKWLSIKTLTLQSDVVLTHTYYRVSLFHIKKALAKNVYIGGKNYHFLLALELFAFRVRSLMSCGQKCLTLFAHFLFLGLRTKWNKVDSDISCVPPFILATWKMKVFLQQQYLDVYKTLVSWKSRFLPFKYLSNFPLTLFIPPSYRHTSIQNRASPINTKCTFRVWLHTRDFLLSLSLICSINR